MSVFDADYTGVGDPQIIFSGRIDNLQIAFGETAEIVCNLENRLADWLRPRIRRYTDADQKDLYPGDRGLEYVAAAVDKEIVWGVQYR